MQIKKLAAKFLAAVLAASMLTGFAALPLDASNEAQTLDYDALNQTLEESKATGRANSIENLDAQPAGPTASRIWTPSCRPGRSTRRPTTPRRAMSAWRRATPPSPTCRCWTPTSTVWSNR